MVFRRRSQTDLPSQQTPAHRPAQTHQQADIAQFAFERALAKRLGVDELGRNDWNAPRLPRARTAARNFFLAATAVPTSTLILPENPNRLQFVACCTSGGPVRISFGQPPFIDAANGTPGILVSLATPGVSQAWPNTFAENDVPLDEIWATTPGGVIAARVVIFEVTQQL